MADAEGVKMRLELANGYNWKGQPERLVYRGRKGLWHQFSLIGNTDIWCEVLESDLYMLQETSNDR